jgi:hypothetical protein
LRLAAIWVAVFAAAVAWLGVTEPWDEGYYGVASALVESGELVRTPQGVGYPLLIAPAVAVGGIEAAELFTAAFAALAFVLAALLARRIVPEPYASAGAALAGLSAPVVALAGELLPQAAAGTLLAGATLCTVAAREEARPLPVFAAGALLAPLPWLDPWFVVPAIPVGVALYVWCRRARRPTMGLIAVELAVASAVVYVTVNERVFGGVTPGAGTGADTVAEHLERLPRLVTLWVDPDAGLLRWAPIFAFVFFGAWLLRRSRSEGLARAVPARATAEAAAGLSLAVVAAVVLVAAFLVPTIDTEPFAARHLVPALPVAAALVAWGLRHAPRVGAALGAVTLVLTATALL